MTDDTNIAPGAPTLTTPYSNQIFTLGESININTSSNWSGFTVTGFGAINLPPGLSISSAGLITGTIAFGGIIGVTITVIGTDGTDDSGGFTMYERL